MSQRLVVLAHAMVSTAGALAEYAIGLVVSIIIARTLGPAEFGIFSYTIWVAGTLFFFCNHGVSVTAIRFTAEARGLERLGLAKAIGHWLGGIQLVSMLVVMLLFVGLSIVVPPQQWSAHAQPVLALVVVAAVAKARYGYLISVAQGHQKFIYSAVAPVVLAFTYLTGALAAKYFHPTVWMFLCAYCVSSVAGFTAIAAMLKRGGLSPSRGEVSEELRSKIKVNLALTAALALLSTVANRTIETFVLSVTASAHDIGFFAIAGTLTKGAVDILTAGLQATLMPVLANSMARRGPSAVGPMVNTAIRYYWFLGLTVAGVGGLAARSVVLIVYGQPFADAVPAVQLTMLGAGLGLVGAVIGASLTTQDKQDDRLRAAAWAAVCNAAIAICLVPAFGLLGAAITFGVARVATTALTFVYFRRSASFKIEYAPCIRMAFAAGAGGLAGASLYVTMPPLWGGGLAAVVFLLVFVPSTVLLGSWQRDDFELLIGVLRKVGVGSVRVHSVLERLASRFARGA